MLTTSGSEMTVSFKNGKSVGVEVFPNRWSRIPSILILEYMWRARQLRNHK
jgi:hypothetical protein